MPRTVVLFTRFVPNCLLDTYYETDTMLDLALGVEIMDSSIGDPPWEEND